jgi:hypothetical protein
MNIAKPLRASGPVATKARQQRRNGQRFSQRFTPRFTPQLSQRPARPASN